MWRFRYLSLMLSWSIVVSKYGSTSQPIYAVRIMR